MGAADAGYLTIKHYNGTPLACGITSGCERVTASVYSKLMGVPVSLLGVMYYLLIAGLAGASLYAKDKTPLILASVFTAVGLLMSAWFVYLQLAVIKSICMYCMLSAGTSTMLFALGLYVLTKEFKYRKIASLSQ